MATTANPQLPADSPEVRRYNRTQRWLGLADTVIGFALLVVLLVTGWTGTLRDWSYLGARQHYFFAVFLYVLMFSLIAKALEPAFRFHRLPAGASISSVEPEVPQLGVG